MRAALLLLALLGVLAWIAEPDVQREAPPPAAEPAPRHQVIEGVATSGWMITCFAGESCVSRPTAYTEARPDGGVGAP